MLLHAPRCPAGPACGKGGPAVAAARWRRRRWQPAARAVRTQQLEAEPEVLEQQLDEEVFLDTADAAMAGAPATQPQPQRVSGGALSLAAAPGAGEAPVPSTLAGALATFFTHPSALLILGALAALLYVRSAYPAHPAADAAVAAAVAVFWCLQEWVIHAKLLHSQGDWLGRRIHAGHHQRPYFHVRLAGWPLLAAAVDVVAGAGRREAASALQPLMLLCLALNHPAITHHPTTHNAPQHKIPPPCRCPLMTHPSCWPSWPPPWASSGAARAARSWA